MISTHEEHNSLDIAIIGMAVRVPGADSLDEYWSNIVSGLEFISRFEADSSDASAPNTNKKATYRGVIGNPYRFDAEFFGFSPRQAINTDPQQRILLECIHEALSNSGYADFSTSQEIGVFASGNTNVEHIRALADHHGWDFLRTAEGLTAYDKDYLAAIASYKLGLTGPAVTIQSACSSSLTAFHLACQSLLAGDTELNIVGGVSVFTPETQANPEADFEFHSSDGHCRPFDVSASGTIFSNGCVAVVLKRIGDALRDSDHIYAVVKGSATNNDGASKVGFVAPSVKGQESVVLNALGISGVPAESIGYVEAHGTGTRLGDPIEFVALCAAYGNNTTKRRFCAIGSVKANIGHLDTASGLAGLVKVALMLQKKVIPPLINFAQPNPQIDLSNSPFFVNTEPLEWVGESGTRYAAVSSLGFGGTNAHVVLSEAPAQATKECDTFGPKLLLTSARTEESLSRLNAGMSSFLMSRHEIPLSNISYTLAKGRTPHRCRSFAVSDDCTSAAANLRDARISVLESGKKRPVVFVFPGQGAQYPRMGMSLYHTNSAFRCVLDDCDALVRKHGGFSLLDVLSDNASHTATGSKSLLDRTDCAQLALFSVAFALAKSLIKVGVTPSALIGHSVGEFAAGCLSGVFDLDEAIRIILARGRLIQSLAPGAMMAVLSSKSTVNLFLPGSLDVACVNAPDVTIVSGKAYELESFEKTLRERGIESRMLGVNRAFHSRMLDPIIDEFSRETEKLHYSEPTIPIYSTATGALLTARDARDPRYWAKHARLPVLLWDAVSNAHMETDPVFLEVGPGPFSISQIRRHIGQASGVSTLARTGIEDERSQLLNAIGQLWCGGAQLDWDRYFEEGDHSRVPLPGYPFAESAFSLNYDSHAPKATASLFMCAPNAHLRPPATGIGETEATHPGQNGINHAHHLTDPANDISGVIAKIFTDVLGISAITSNSSFIELGGNSLIAAHLSTQIGKTCGVKISIGEIIRNDTVAKISDLVLANLDNPFQFSSQSSANPDTATGSFPISLTQQRWYTSRNERTADRFVISKRLTFDQTVDRDWLEVCINSIVDDHEILRTSYSGYESDAGATVHDLPTIRVPLVDLSSTDHTRDNVHLSSHFDTFFHSPIDTSQAPLFKFQFVKFSTDNYELWFAVHHIIFDGLSFDCFFRELSGRYNLSGEYGLTTQRPQYRVFVEWERTQCEKNAFSDDVDYWGKQLKDRPSGYFLPTARIRPNVKSLDGVSDWLRVDRGLEQTIRDTAKTLKCTPFVFLSAVLMILLANKTKASDVVLGTPASRRLLPETKSMIGMFAHALILRSTIDEQETFDAFVDRLKSTYELALDHQNVPFQHLLDKFAYQCDMSTNPFFEVLFGYLMPQFEKFYLGSCESVLVAVLPKASRFDFSLYFSDDGDSLWGWYTFNPDLFEQGTIDAMVRSYLQLVDEICRSPYSAIRDFNLDSFRASNLDDNCLLT